MKGLSMYKLTYCPPQSIRTERIRTKEKINLHLLSTEIFRTKNFKINPHLVRTVLICIFTMEKVRNFAPAALHLIHTILIRTKNFKINLQLSSTGSNSHYFAQKCE